MEGRGSLVGRADDSGASVVWGRGTAWRHGLPDVVLADLADAVEVEGLPATAQDTFFGWFNTLQIDAKGHPISRVARMVNADA